MQTKDRGIIVAKRLSGEKSAIITIFTEQRGLYSFYVKNISGKNSVTYQSGNIVDLFLTSKQDEQMGFGRCELIFGASHFMQTKTKLYALNSLLAMVLASFEEGVTHSHIYALLNFYIKNSAKSFKIIDYFRLESEILSESGYGLDLSSCAATGVRDSLIYVSPKSGRAVSAKAGEEYKDKLLTLPLCALKDLDIVENKELLQMANLLLYFFKRYVFKRGEPQARTEFIKYISAIA